MEYTVAVRTLGKAGDKYQRLLNSIDSLVPKPKEVIIALPHGYEIPPERLGYEKFIFCTKGMVSQRIHVLDYISTDLILFLDDDLEFSHDLFSKLYNSMTRNKCYIVYPICRFFVPQQMLIKISFAIAGVAFPMMFQRSKYHIKILGSAAYSYNTRIDRSDYEAQSGPGICFLTTRKALETISIIDEVEWLEMMGYSFGDDQTMFYKYYLAGYKIFAVSDIYIEHLHAKTTTRDRARQGYCFAFFRYIFWYRFIYSRSKKRFFDVMPFYCCYFQYLFVWPLVNLINRENPLKVFRSVITGYFDARRLINSGNVSEFL